MMKQESLSHLPGRITDLIEAKKSGVAVSVRPTFEIVPVEFLHRDHPFNAYIFLCHYGGEINGYPYDFRKCYARGCKHNLCIHVSLAVLIANRFLQRDYKKMDDAGLEVEKQFFSMEEMVVKFGKYETEHGQDLSLPDCVKLAKEGNQLSASIKLEYVPAVENFSGQKNSQVFLMAGFDFTWGDKVYPCERCFSCYPAEDAEVHKKRATDIANARLELLYMEFDEAGIEYRPSLFA